MYCKALDSNFSFELDINERTAIINEILCENDEILIPRSIIYENQEYMITDIMENAMKSNKKVRNVKFSEDIALESFRKNIFSACVKSISIPRNIIELKEGWCKSANRLTEVLISPNNTSFGYLDEYHKLIGRKSDPCSHDYDILEFACRDIEVATIPSTVKHINPYSFSKCQILQTVKISEDSQLISIGKKAFSSCFCLYNFYFPANLKYLHHKKDDFPSILKVTISPQNDHFGFLDDTQKLIGYKSDPKQESYDTVVLACRDIIKAVIPSQIKKIESNSFSLCYQLNSIEFSEDSELLSIGSCAFYATGIKELFIPSKVEELQDGWLNVMIKLERIDISSENKNFLIKDEVIYSKSDRKNDFYDIIVYGNKNINKIVVSPLITNINSSAFASSNLRTIEISEDSQLQKIGKFAFSHTLIEYIFIPKHVRKIEVSTFSYTQNLKQIEFDKNSELTSIDAESFNSSQIEKITIPRHVKQIGIYAFSTKSTLKIIDFQKDTEMTFFENSFFSYCNSESIVFPSNLVDVGKNWCQLTPKLNQIIIQPDNQNFSYLDKEHKLVVKKSNKNSDVFDVLIFASRDIEKVIIPSQIKYINPYAFDECRKLKTIEFEENSELISIGDNAFSHSLIESISNIPKSLKNISTKSFGYLPKLKKLTFSEDSELQVIQSKAFYNSSIESISIPKSVIELKEGWCGKTNHLNHVLLCPKSTNFCYLDEDHKLIGGKTDIRNEIYDVLEFACRDIEKVIILPSSIKIISSHSFESCKHLKSIQISKDSQLISIKKYAFCDSNLANQIFIPKNVEFIGESAFENCMNLKAISFDNDSKLNSIESYSFSGTQIKSVILPKNAIKFEMLSFSNDALIAIEFLCDELSFDHKWFNQTNICLISLPNARKISINDAFRYFGQNFSLFINCNSEIQQ